MGLSSLVSTDSLAGTRTSFAQMYYYPLLVLEYNIVRVNTVRQLRPTVVGQTKSQVLDVPAISSVSCMHFEVSCPPLPESPEVLAEQQRAPRQSADLTNVQSKTSETNMSRDKNTIFHERSHVVLPPRVVSERQRHGCVPSSGLKNLSHTSDRHWKPQSL